MKAYIDTSVVISAYKPDETSHDASVQIAKQDTIAKIGSYVLVTELFSVISRLYRDSQVKMPSPITNVLSKLPMEERTYTLINAIILDWNLSCPNLGLDVEQMRLKNFSLSMPEVLLDACTLAPKVGLKTLDLMHIACAKIMNEVSGDLRYFVTLDRDILSNRELIDKMAELQPLTPQKFLDLI